MFKHLLLIALSIFLLSACGSGSGTGSSDTGAISFNVDWDQQSAESVKSAIRASSDVCSDYGIETVNADVINSSSSSVASGSWACSAHSGTISSVPVGSGYTVQLEGLDSGGTVTWSGSVTGISVTANTTASAGTITMTYIGSDSTPPYIVSFDPLQDATDVPVTTTITATFNVGMAPSTINTDTFTLFDYGTNSYVSGSVTYDSSTMTATFTPSANLSYGTMYMANMQAGSNGVLDYKGWGIIGTTWVQFTTEDEPTSAPSAPTGVSATAGDSQVEITWTASTGATSYNIYYSTTSGVTKTTGTKITGATSPYTHTDLTNGTTYYYVVTADNSYGESVESSEVSGMPAATSLMGGSIQSASLNLTTAVTTLAGTAGSIGSTDGTGSAARFFSPRDITTDGTSLYVAEFYNYTIRKIVISTGVVTTLAGSAGTVGSTDGTGTAARFNYPSGITTDGTSLYVCDTYNNTIRKIVISTGVVTTLAGSAGTSGTTDATGTAARFDYPAGITTDGANLYVSDANNKTIRKIVISTGVVTTLAGTAGATGSTDGIGTAARFSFPTGITTDGTSLYVDDSYNYTIRKIVISTGVVTTLAGSAGTSGTTDATGTAARFNNPTGITTDGTSLYVADSNNHTVRKIVISTGVVTTLAGLAGTVGSTDGTGTAARFYGLQGITTDGTSLYVADGSNQTVRRIQ